MDEYTKQIVDFALSFLKTNMEDSEVEAMLAAHLKLVENEVDYHGGFYDALVKKIEEAQVGFKGREKVICTFTDHDLEICGIDPATVTDEQFNAVASELIELMCDEVWSERCPPLIRETLEKIGWKPEKKEEVELTEGFLERCQESVGTCPVCGRTPVWFNNVPLTAYCWGSETFEHPECRRIVPSPVQPYGEKKRTRWVRTKPESITGMRL